MVNWFERRVIFLIKTIDKFNMCKLKCRNHIIFIKQGVFYITVGTDAILLNRILGLKLTNLSISVKVGIPVNSVRKYENIMQHYDIPYAFMDCYVISSYDGNFDFVEKTDEIKELLKVFYIKDELIEIMIKYGEIL